MKGLYILTNNILVNQNTIKLGMSMTLENRIFDYSKVFTNNKYLYCYHLKKVDKNKILYIEKKILDYTEEYYNSDFSSEFRKITNEFTFMSYHNIIIDFLEKYKIEYKIYEEPTFEKVENYESENINRCDELNNIKINPFICKRDEIQTDYLDKIIINLNIDKRSLVIAPTGFGKTFIFYKLINNKNYKSIIVLSPRKILNKQNSDKKYTDILDHNFKIIIFNKSKKNKKIIKNKLENNERIIIYLCYQSSKKLYKLIKKYNIDLIVFDEAHFIQTWENMEEKYIKYFIKSSYIKNRLFLTATPSENMLNNNEIFGKEINLIKVYELINYGILCNIETIIKKMNCNKNNYHSLYSLIEKSIIKYNKKKGIIYTNTQDNAIQIYKLFNINKKEIKAYIYVSKQVELYNDLDNDINDFEENDQPCVIITCKKIDYGYDNLFIDFICFADPKQSYTDIKQIMGRGLRNNQKLYPNKILHVLLPIYEADINIENEYGHIIEYLKYIIEEGGQDLINDNFNGFDLSGNKKLRLQKNYDGDIIPLEICKLLSTTSYHQYTRFIRFLKENNIYDERNYNLLQSKNNWMPLLCNIKKKYKKFGFRDIHPYNKSYYFEKKDCKDAIKIAHKILIEQLGINKVLKISENKLLIEYNKIDNKIPIVDIEWYYPENL